MNRFALRKGIAAFLQRSEVGAVVVEVTEVGRESRTRDYTKWTVAEDYSLKEPIQEDGKFCESKS